MCAELRAATSPMTRFLRITLGFLWLTLLAPAYAGVGSETKTRVDADQLPRFVPSKQGASRVSGSARIVPGEYARRAQGRDGILLLEGLRDVTLFLDEVTFVGTPTSAQLETCVSGGIVLRDCQNVRIHGGVLRGYHTAIYAERCSGLVLEGIAIDGTYARRLRSTIAVESDEDRIEWPAPGATGFDPDLGAAIRLVDCSDVVVRNCGARHGQNGLLASNSERIDFYRNDFSFLSGWGVAALSVEGLRVAHNRIDYCLRGYSEGFYASGQHSAAFVLLGDSRDNIFAKNSANRAGTSVVLRDLPGARAGSGGDPTFGTLIWGNDFSGSIAGAVEIERAHDVWIAGNLFENCHPFGILAQAAERLLIGGNSLGGVPGAAIALEDPLECVVVRNVLTASEVGLEVWSASTEDGSFVEHQPAQARDLWILRNSFTQNDADLGLRDVRGLRVRDNVFEGAEHAPLISELKAAAGVPQLLLEGRDPETGEDLPEKPEPRSWLRGLGDRMPSGHLWRATIWHPEADPHPLVETFARFKGPAVPGHPLDDIVRSLAPADLAVGEWGPWDFESGVDRPTLRQPGGVLTDVDWHATWFLWEAESDPRGDLARWRARADAPLYTDVVRTWATPYGADDSRAQIIGRRRVGLIATCRTSLSGGPYRLTVVSDDGVRFLVDGRTVLENWTWHPARRDTVEFELEAGVHEFRIEYFQIDGPAALLVDLDRLSPSRTARQR